MFAERITEHGDQEDEQSERQTRDLAICGVADITLALPDEPAGAEQRIAEAETDSAEYGKGTEPPEIATGILTVYDRQALDKRTDCQTLNERCRKR